MTDERNVLTEKMAAALPILRTKRGLTQERLAELLDLSRHTVLLIEHGKRQMPFTTFLALYFLFSQDGEGKALLEAMGVSARAVETCLKG